MTENEDIRTPRVRKLLHGLFVFGIIFVSLENATTYLSLTLRKELIEVGPSIYFINIFGLELGILLSFSIVFLVIFLSYYGALRWLPKRKESETSRHAFRYCFIVLAGLCFGLFPSAYNDTSGLVSGYAPIGALDTLSRYFFLLIFVMIGVATALIVESRLPVDYPRETILGSH